MPDFAQKSYLIRIVDDDPEFLDAISLLLETNGWRTATYTDPKRFLDEFDNTAAGVIILDVRMPQMDGTEVLEQLSGLGNIHPVVFLTGHGDMDLAIHALRKGVCDFLQKPVTPEDLLTALYRAIDADDARVKSLAGSSARSLWDKLTAREQEVMRCVSQHLSNKAIAERMGISARTVEAHRFRAMFKLNLHKTAQVEAFFAEHGL